MHDGEVLWVRGGGAGGCAALDAQEGRVQDDGVQERLRFGFWPYIWNREELCVGGGQESLDCGFS